MAEFKGYSGNIKFAAGAGDPVAIGNAHVWGLTLAGDTVEITDFSSVGWKEFLGTLKSWSITGEAYWDEADTPQGALRGAMAGAGKIELLTGDGTKAYFGSVIVTSWDVGAAVDSVITASFGAQGTGALDYDTPT